MGPSKGENRILRSDVLPAFPAPSGGSVQESPLCLVEEPARSRIVVVVNVIQRVGHIRLLPPATGRVL